MKIGDSTPVNRPGAVRRAGSAAATSVDNEDDVRQISDSVSIMDIPANEMTPKVRAAIMNLMQEVDRMRRDLEMARRRLAELEKLADQDTLAPIGNRRAFVREMSRTVSFAERYNIPASLIFIDVNGLKSLNDTYGHAAGDAALLHVANTLLNNVRGSDLVGRLGGDEFGVILPSTDEAAAQIKAQQLAEMIKKTPFQWNDNSLHVSIAHGVFSFQPGSNPGSILDEADKKMYAQKRMLKIVP